MVFISGTTQYDCISVCLQGTKTEVCVCEAGNDKRKYYIWAVKDGELAKKFTKIFSMGDRQTEVEIFSMGELYCIVFPYQEKRNLMDFALTESVSVSWAKAICEKLVFLCMSSKLPWELLYILLTERKINISREQSVYFTYDINPEQTECKTEKDCVAVCGVYLAEFLEHIKCTNWSGYQLMLKKNKRKNYHTFAELYQDIKNGVVINKIESGKSAIVRFLKRKKPMFIRLLKVACIVIGCLALMVFLSELVFDNSPFTRLFINSFKKIGTESLLQ